MGPFNYYSEYVEIDGIIQDKVILSSKKEGMYSKLFYEYWVYPGEEYKPKAADYVGDSAYWKR